MRPVSVFAEGPGSEIEQLRADLHGRWRQATRAVMVLLSLHGLAPAQIAALLECHPATVRRWISRFNREGMAGLADRPRCGRPRLGGRRLTGRIAALLARPGPWTCPRIRRYLGWPQVSPRTLYRRVRLVAIWRRPKLTARGDPAHDHVVAGIVARLIDLPRRSVVLAEDETHLNLLPHVRPQIPTPGTNRQVTVLGAIEVTTGAWVYWLGQRCAADFIALLDMLAEAFPRAPVIVVICDNDSIHHARTVTAYLKEHPRLELLYGARYSPHDNPAERIWAALKNYVANTAVTWPGRQRQIHAFFRSRSPDKMLATAAPWTRAWLPPGYEQNFWNAALAVMRGWPAASGAYGDAWMVAAGDAWDMSQVVAGPARAGAPAHPVPRRHGLLGDLDWPGDVFARLGPNWFAPVMGTGIVATAAADLPVRWPGLRGFAAVVWVLSAVWLITLAGAEVVLWTGHRAAARGHARNPVMVQFYGAPPMALLTVGAGALW